MRSPVLGQSLRQAEDRGALANREPASEERGATGGWKGAGFLQGFLQGFRVSRRVLYGLSGARVWGF